MTSRHVLVCGGTRGIGKAIAQAFAREGAQISLTHRWGSVSEEELREEFTQDGLPPPRIYEADIGQEEDTSRLMQALERPVDVLVVSVCVAIRGKPNLRPRTLRQTLHRSAWPLKAYFEALAAAHGAPNYTLALSSDGHQHFYPGYDYVAAAKALLESFCAELSSEHPQCFFGVRPRQVDTKSLHQMFPPEAQKNMRRFAEFDLKPEEVGKATVELCSGRLDTLSGQTITLDHGATFLDNLVSAGPRLLGGPAAWEQPDDASVCPQGLLYVDLGYPLKEGSFAKALHVSAEQAKKLEQLPRCVIVGHGEQSNVVNAGFLIELLQQSEQRGYRPDYAIELYRRDTSETVLSQTLGRYHQSWRILTDLHVNFVTGPPHAVEDVVDALIGGNLDCIRGQHFVL